MEQQRPEIELGTLSTRQNYKRGQVHPEIGIVTEDLAGSLQQYGEELNERDLNTRCLLKNDVELNVNTGTHSPLKQSLDNVELENQIIEFYKGPSELSPVPPLQLAKHFSQNPQKYRDSLSIHEEFKSASPKMLHIGLKSSSKPGETSLNQSKLKGYLQNAFFSKMVNISEYMVSFSYKNFIVFFLYNLIWLELGFVATLVVLIIESKILVTNMAFWHTTPTKRAYFFQLFIWILLTILNLLLLFNLLSEHLSLSLELRNIFPEQTLCINIHILIRSFLIAVRYGYMSSVRLNFIRTTSVGEAYLTNDLLLLTWNHLDPQTLGDETVATIWRQEVEELYFKIQLIESISDDLNEMLMQENYFIQHKYNEVEFASSVKGMLRELQQKRKETQVVDIYQDDYEQYRLYRKHTITKDKFYSGKLILRYIALLSNIGAISPLKLGYVSFALRATVPYFARWYAGVGPFDFDASAIIYSVIELLCSFLIISTNYSFIGIGITDFSRRLFMVRACGAMLNPLKTEYSIWYQVLPTINLACRVSLRSWFSLRLCVMDLGRKYMNRIFVYSSVFLAIYLTFGIIFALDFFMIVDLEISEMLMFIISFDIILMLGLILVMFNLGAMINQQYVEDKQLLLKMKSTLLFIKSNMRAIHEVGAFTSPFMKTYSKIIKDYGQDFNEEQLKLVLEGLLEEIEYIIQKIEYDFEHKPLKILGLKATYGLMNTIYTTLASLGFAMLQSYFGEPEEKDSQNGSYGQNTVNQTNTSQTNLTLP